jgi:hypothetical protein
VFEGTTHAGPALLLVINFKNSRMGLAIMEDIGLFLS